MISRDQPTNLISGVNFRKRYFLLFFAILSVKWFCTLAILRNQCHFGVEVLMPHFDVATEGVNCRISLSSLWKYLL